MCIARTIIIVRRVYPSTYTVVQTSHCSLNVFLRKILSFIVFFFFFQRCTQQHDDTYCIVVRMILLKGRRRVDESDQLRIQ